MSEWFLSLGPVEWFREQFEGCPEDALTCDSISAQELFRFVLIAWVVAAVVLIALDRLGSGLWGRSRPLAQEPPQLARSWRWGRKPPPANYSLLPPGTTVQSAAPTLPETTPVERPVLPALPVGGAVVPGAASTVTLIDPGSDVSDNEYWNTFAGSVSPILDTKMMIVSDAGTRQSVTTPSAVGSRVFDETKMPPSCIGTGPPSR